MLVEDGMSWRTRYTNSVLIGNKIWPNDTEVTIHFSPCTDDPKQQHITFEKYKYVFNKILQNSVFVENQKQYEVFKNYNEYVIDFCQRPVDQIVGVSLFAKLNSIGGDFLKINLLQIESWQGENIKFVINEESPEWDIIKTPDKEYNWLWDKNPHWSNFKKTKLTWEEIGFIINDYENSFTVIKGGRK